MKDELEWGKVDNLGQHSDRLVCTNENCSRSKDMAQLLDVEYEARVCYAMSKNLNGGDKPYSAFFSCDLCGRRFWYHITENDAREFKNQREKLGLKCE